MYFLIAIFLIISPFNEARTQTLPQPAKHVYRCEQNGKISYSDEPCMGAKRVDVTPTRGMDKWTGEQRTGPDVNREKSNEQMANGLKPIFGETPEQRETRHRRARLTGSEKMECMQLDSEMRKAEGTNTETTDEALYQMRKRYRALKC